MRLISVLLMGIILITFFITNPKTSDFDSFANVYIRKNFEEAGVTAQKYISMVVRSISNLEEARKTGARIIIEDYYLFSIFRMESNHFSFDVLGILGQFIVLGHSIDTPLINKLYQEPKVILNENRDIYPNSYNSKRIFVPIKSELIVESRVIGGQPLDVFVFDELGFDRYTKILKGKKEIFSPISELSFSTSNYTKKSSIVQRGYYYLVHDNTTLGLVSPKQKTSIQIDLPSNVRMTVSLKDIY